MKLEILRIERRIVTCQVDGGPVLDVARRWLAEDIQVGDVIAFDISKVKENN